MSEESTARIRLAGPVLVQTRTGAGQPLLLSEIAQLRFLAESDEEREMPLEQLAIAVLDRERKRMGISFPAIALWGARHN